MVYQNKLVAAVKVNGKVLREPEPGVFRLPFRSEYSLLLKNVSTLRCAIKVSIDGEDVLEGHALIIQPNTALDLEDFIREGAIRKRFKFIQETKSTQEHRGTRVDDGLVRIEYAFEIPPVLTYRYLPVTPYVPVSVWPMGNSTLYGLPGRFVSTANACATPTVFPEAGFTAPGSDCFQRLAHTDSGPLGPWEVLVLRLLGETAAGPVTTVCTTKTKLICSSCGRRCKSFMKFCPECGTSLTCVRTPSGLFFSRGADGYGSNYLCVSEAGGIA